MLNMKNHCVYKDKEVNHYGQVTVVKGTCDVKDNVLREIKRLVYKVNDASEITPHVETIGKTKCDADDTFDTKKGLIVASRKAELKATIKICKEVTKLRQEVEELYRFLLDIEDKIDYKAGRLSLDLVEMRCDTPIKKILEEARAIRNLGKCKREVE